MNILFVTYPSAGLNKGGLQLQIEETRKAIIGLGSNVELYNSWHCDLSDVDIIHVFSLNPAVKPFVDAALERDIPVVVSPIFSSYHKNDAIFRLKVFLSRRLPGLFTFQKLSAAIISTSNKVIALSEEEKEKLVSAFPITKSAIHIVPNGVNRCFLDSSPNKFVSKYGVSNFVLTVGRVEEWKNQLELIRACKKLGKKLVIIGPANAKSKNYYHQCRSEADESVLFIDELRNDDPLLASAYKAASIFALVSRSEVFPISALEAAAANCKLLITDNCAIKSVFVGKDGVVFVKPFNESIITGIQRADSLGVPDMTSEIASNYTWNAVAKTLMQIYRTQVYK